MLASKNAHLFHSSPDWTAYVSVHPEVIAPEITPPLDLIAKRAEDLSRETAWAADHPPESYGYRKQRITVGHTGSLADLYLPLGHTEQDPPLPVLFLTHGGGFVFSTPIRDERWFLYGLLSQSKTRFVVISIDYKLAPEHPYPAAQEECWAALQEVVQAANSVFGIRNVVDTKIILAGSSTGAGLATHLAQRARDAGLQQVVGAVLNVPTLCHPDVFPNADFEQCSYEQCRDGCDWPRTNLTAEHMKQMWDLYVPNDTPEKCAQASPFLGDTKGLVPHAVFVAGQDPLRDEGLAYAEKLHRGGCRVELRVYEGVPHNFGSIWELATCQKFQQHLTECVDWILKLADKAVAV